MPGETVAERAEHAISVLTDTGQRYYTDVGFLPTLAGGAAGVWGKLIGTTPGEPPEGIPVAYPHARCWVLPYATVDPTFGYMSAGEPRAEIDRDLEALAESTVTDLGH